MSTEVKDDPPRSTLSFYECAAWISLFISVFLALAAGAICAFPLFEGETLLSVYVVLFCCLGISLTLGVISLLGFRRHKRHLTLWIALMGCLVSAGLAAAEVVFLFIIMSGFGHQ